MNIFDVLRAAKSRRIDAAEALPGRDAAAFDTPPRHAVLGSPLRGPFPADTETIYLAMGCFWGAEELYWRLPGVFSTAVGFQGGFTTFPTYEQVCTGLTGHTETAMIVYEPDVISAEEILRRFWENHDPTQGMRQGNDIGTQYRSAVFTTTDEQAVLARRTRELYQAALAAQGWDEITTEILPAADHPFYYAEPHHQQYLHKVPNGYRCHSATGIALPVV